jgi:hypothetical protein
MVLESMNQPHGQACHAVESNKDSLQSAKGTAGLSLKENPEP